MPVQIIELELMEIMQVCDEVLEAGSGLHAAASAYPVISINYPC